jgi:hypothetical protein
MGGLLNQIKNKYAIEGRLTNRLGCPPYSLLNYDGRRFESELEKLSMGGGLVRIHLKNWKGGGSSFVRGEADPNNAASPDERWFVMLLEPVGWEEWFNSPAHDYKHNDSSPRWKPHHELYTHYQIALKGTMFLNSTLLEKDDEWRFGIGNPIYLTIRRPVGAKGYWSRGFPTRAEWRNWMWPRVMGRWSIELQTGYKRNSSTSYLLYKPQIERFEK